MEKKNKDIVLIGGFPQPVGGVTTFIKRLVLYYENQVSAVVDLYPSKEKNIPKSYKGKHIMYPSILGYLFMIIVDVFFSNKKIHFNFSTTKMLYVLFLVPRFKKSNEWWLTLHHAKLAEFPHPFIKKRVLKKYNFVTIINESQKEFYKDHLSSDQIISVSSYVKPVAAEDEVSEEFKEKLVKFNQTKKVFIASGFPRDYYNFEWLINYFKDKNDSILLIFYYGEGNYKEQLLGKTYENVEIFGDLKEEYFNYALSKSLCYLRPTMKDSLGIAVCDAICFDTAVIATDVCPRYKGVYLTKPTQGSFIENLEKFYQNDMEQLLIETNEIIPFEYKK